MSFARVLALLSVGLLASSHAARGQGFESCTPGPLPLAPGGTCLWYSKGGTAVAAPNGAVSQPTCGFPTEGGQWGIVSSLGASGGFAVPAGGPAPSILTPGSAGNATLPSSSLGSIPTPPPACALVILFDWTWVTPECAADPQYNDFLTIDLVDPISGTSRQNLLYRDTHSASLVGGAGSPDPFGTVPTGFCTPPGALEECLGCTNKCAAVRVHPSLYGQAVDFEINVGDGFDSSFPSHAHIDNVRLVITTASSPNTPLSVFSQTSGAGDLTVTLHGLIPGLETWHVFSFELCPTGCGNGPILGLCAADPVVTLLPTFGLPLGTFPFHFQANACSMITVLLPPATIPPGLCVESLVVQWAPLVPAFRVGPVISFATQ